MQLLLLLVVASCPCSHSCQLPLDAVVHLGCTCSHCRGCTFGQSVLVVVDVVVVVVWLLWLPLSSFLSVDLGCSCSFWLCLQLLSRLHLQLFFLVALVVVDAVVHAIVIVVWLLRLPLQSFLSVALGCSCSFQLHLQLLSRLHLWSFL